MGWGSPVILGLYFIAALCFVLFYVVENRALSPIIDFHLFKNRTFLVGLLANFTLAFYYCVAFLQLFFKDASSITLITISFAAMGVGWACILSPSIVAVLSSIPPTSTGAAVGGMSTLHNFGGALGLSLGTLLYAFFAKSNLLSQGLVLPNNAAQIVADPEKALTILPVNVVKSFFLSGYHSAMVLLVAVSTFAFILIFFGMKKINTQNSTEHLII